MPTTYFSSQRPALGRWLPVILGAFFLSACTTNAGLSPDKHSGFLGESYDRLQPVPTSQAGVNIYRYKNPAFDISKYKGVMIEPVVIYQTASADAAAQGITAENLRNIHREIDATLDRDAREHFNVVKKPGPGIARVSVAITGAQALGDGFKPRNLVPVSAVLTMASMAAGVQNKNALIVVEAKLQDSVSGMTLGQALYTVSGENFRLQSSSDPAFEALAAKWVRTALGQAVGERAQLQ
jgi:hypothetical protein